MKRFKLLWDRHLEFCGGMDDAGLWTQDKVSAAFHKCIATRDHWDASFLGAMQRLAASPPDNAAEIGYFVEGLRAANAGEILADAPVGLQSNLLAAIDPSLLAWPTARALQADCWYGDKGGVIPRRLMAVFDEIDAIDEVEEEAEARATEHAREVAKKAKSRGKPH